MGLIALLILVPLCIWIDRYNRRPGVGMRATTGVAIGGFVAWILFNTVANSSAPSSLDDPNFTADIQIANVWATFAMVSLLVGIGSIGLTIWHKLMNEPKAQIAGDVNLNYFGRLVTRPTNVGALNQGDHVADVSGKADGIETSVLVNRDDLIEQIDKLRAEVRKLGHLPEHDEALGTLGRAARLAQKGEVEEAIATLKTVGNWVKEIAKAVGVGLIVRLLTGS